MKLALVQMRGDGLRDYKNTFERVLQLAGKACASGADLVLLPECAYPAYFLGLDESLQKQALARVGDLMQAFSQLAAQTKTYMVLGIALPDSGKLYNAAVAFGRDGKEVGRAYKSNLWHFDGRWFTAGTHSCVFDTEFGKIGMMVCADGRVPEVARLLRLRGARLILDTVNLVATASEPVQLQNAQHTYMLPVRARENGAWIAVADKAGVEEHTVIFAGKSMLIDPEGEVVACASPDREEILCCEADLSRARPITGRHPAAYGALAAQIALLPVHQKLGQPLAPHQLEQFLFLAKYAAGDTAEYLEKACFYIRAARLSGAKLMLLPPLTKEAALGKENVWKLQALLEQGELLAVAGQIKQDGQPEEHAALLLERDRMERLPADNSQQPKVVETAFGGIAALFGRTMELPEPTRAAMLLGADLVLWYDEEADAFDLKLMQTRAAENKIYVARISNLESGDASRLVTPAGATACVTFSACEQGVSAYLNLGLCRAKGVAPGTHIVDGRIPSFYKELTV